MEPLVRRLYRPLPGGIAWRLLWVMLLALWVGGGSVEAAEAPPAKTDEPRRLEEVIAGYLAVFARDVTWPVTALAPGQSLRIGVFADRGIYPTIAGDLEGGEGESRPLEAVPVRGRRDVVGCHVIYLHNPSAELLTDILAATRGKPVLTIIYSGDRTVRGGVIELFIDDRKSLKYLLNPRELSLAGLRPSPELLQFALRTPPR